MNGYQARADELVARDLEGKVKFFDDRRGLGFIVHPDGDVFVHYSQIVRREGDAPRLTLADDERVRYDCYRHVEGRHEGKLYAGKVRRG